MVKFEAGKTYYTSSLGDSNCIIKVEIVARTAKTVQARVNGDPMQVFRVKPTWDKTAEMIKPWGSFSMAPSLSANDTKVLVPDWAKSQNPVVIEQHANLVKELRALPVLRLVQGGRA